MDFVHFDILICLGFRASDFGFVSKALRPPGRSSPLAACVARRRRVPIVIHTREDEDDTFRILVEESADDIGGVFHCFTGHRKMAMRALDFGFHISLAGIVTFPKALELREVAKMVPLDRLLIETDCPYLAPVPHRGKRNEPAHVTYVADIVAKAKGVRPDVVASAAHENFLRLFTP